MDLVEVSARAMTHESYRALFEVQVKDGTGSGPPGGGYGADYTKLNLARTRRLERTLLLLPEVRVTMEAADAQTWLVLTEPWCGDSAQNLPVIVALAEHAPAITVRVLLRDAHLGVMDRYLTNGSRSIPKLVSFDPSSGRELFTWGPRPARAQELVLRAKQVPEAQRATKEALATELHTWYAANAGRDTQLELAGLVKGLRIP
ncbi:MAG: thioredoxin family protein [Flavobacteriales bacterium]|nr:thioredoxin family protein [Flavobacteriales bacterium]